MAVILAMLTRAGLTCHVIVVSRCNGGTPLGGDRLRHLQAATRHQLCELA